MVQIASSQTWTFVIGHLPWGMTPLNSETKRPVMSKLSKLLTGAWSRKISKTEFAKSVVMKVRSTQLVTVTSKTVKTAGSNELTRK